MCNLYLEFFKKEYLDEQKNLLILGVGDNLNGSEIFSEPNWVYKSLNENGSHADILVNDMYIWDEISANSFDVVFSVDLLNNLKFFWLTLVQMEKILKNDGFICIIVHNDKLNKNFYDFSQKSLRALAQYVNLDVIDVKSKNDEICLIAKKNSETKMLLRNSYENELIKNKYSSILEDYKVYLNSINNQNLILNNYYSNVESLLSELESSKKYYCPICETYHDGFLPFGNPMRFDAKCPNCGSLERHRFIYLYLKNKTNIFNKNSKVFQFNPINSLYNLFKKNNRCYISGGTKVTGNIDKIIDLEKITFEDNYFDYVLNFHILDKVKDDIKVISELYRVVKPYEDGGLVLINVPILRDETQEYGSDDLTSNESFNESKPFRVYGHDIIYKLEDVGFSVDICKSNDFLDSKLLKIYGIVPDYLFICKK